LSVATLLPDFAGGERLARVRRGASAAPVARELNSEKA